MKKGWLAAVAIVFLMVASGCGNAVTSGFPEVTTPYAPEQAAKNGDVVIMWDAVHNLDKWEAFLKNMDKGKPAQMRITRYTDEGAPIFNEFVYDGARIHYAYDNRLDEMGYQRRESGVCTGLAIGERWDEQAWLLQGCEPEELVYTFSWPLSLFPE